MILTSGAAAHAALSSFQRNTSAPGSSSKFDGGTNGQIAEFKLQILRAIAFFSMHSNTPQSVPTKCSAVVFNTTNGNSNNSLPAQMKRSIALQARYRERDIGGPGRRQLSRPCAARRGARNPDQGIIQGDRREFGGLDFRDGRIRWPDEMIAVSNLLFHRLSR